MEILVIGRSASQYTYKNLIIASDSYILSFHTKDVVMVFDIYVRNYLRLYRAIIQPLSVRSAPKSRLAETRRPSSFGPQASRRKYERRLYVPCCDYIPDVFYTTIVSLFMEIQTNGAEHATDTTLNTDLVSSMR